VSQPTSTQTLAVWLAFIAAGFSLAAVVIGYSTKGTINVTPLFGGLLMLALGISGLLKLRKR
jgi:hypothetical protein